MSVKRKMLKDDGYKHEYTKFIDKMLKNGHARECTTLSNKEAKKVNYGIYHITVYFTRRKENYELSWTVAKDMKTDASMRICYRVQT